MMRPLLVLGCGLLLAACSGGPQTAGVCQLERVAVLTMVPSNGHVVVEGKLNQGAARFVLDSGAERSHVTTDAVQRYGLARSRNGHVRMVGVGGTIVAPTVFANLELGGSEVRREVAAADLPQRMSGAPLAGLIGADLLSDYDVEISFPEGVVRLWRAHGCDGTDVPWAGRHWTVPLRKTSGGRLLLTVSIDGRPITAILDTGANLSMLDADAADRLALTPAILAADPAVGSTGVDGNRLVSRRHRFESLAIGPETVHQPRLAVSGVHLTQADMLLGTDWMRTRRVWISWGARAMFVQPAVEIGAR